MPMLNAFLPKLLDLQQDGKSAISAPTNWDEKPLLEVKTDITEILGNLQNEMLIGENKNQVARWHFFVGSPGNGKSAAVGALSQNLERAGCKVCTADKEELAHLSHDTIPYELFIYEKGNNFASAQIVQDASVVPNPYATKVDPAKDLMGVISGAWDRGISLVVCTNRGVLEKLFHDNHLNREINTMPWFKIIRDLVGPVMTEHNLDFNAKKPKFRKVKVTCSPLDNRSLLLGRDIFSQLVEKAVSASNWQSCEACSVRSMCPFKSNQEWLADEDLRKKFLKLLTRAEILSGQVVVFREALALISFILAGCPNDYADKHPCEWVVSKVQAGDVFALAARRIYMNLFASYCPDGLESEDLVRKRQIASLSWLNELTEGADEVTSRALENILNEAREKTSTNVGVTRLLGFGGILARLDPTLESLSSDFYNEYDGDFDSFTKSNNQFLTEIEKTCLRIWQRLEEALEAATDYAVHEGHWALRRWSSNFMLHFGGLLEGRSAWERELDDFADILDFLNNESKTAQQQRQIKELNTQIAEMLDLNGLGRGGRREGKPNHTTVSLSRTVTLLGDWVKTNLTPKMLKNDASGSVSLRIMFADKAREAKGEQSTFSAELYAWLKRKNIKNLDSRCFPADLLGGIVDARIRAAANGQYAFAEDDVELLVNGLNHEVYQVSRFRNQTEINFSPK